MFGIEQPSAGVPPRQLVTESLQQRPVWFRNGDVIKSLVFVILVPCRFHFGSILGTFWSHFGSFLNDF